MKIVENILSARKALQGYRQQNRTIAFVPTMGNLHEGHLSLVNRAKELADGVVVSIFVNPLQFAPHEDFSTYPRTRQRDLALLQDHGVSMVYIPDGSELVNHVLENNTAVFVPGLSKELCGVSRSHFFQGVTTIVSKLFNIVQPDFAIFGEKDYQQLTILRQMTKELCFPIQIHSGPTIREANGLAMSSRNQYLSEQEKEHAVGLYQTLKQAAQAILKGFQADYSILENEAIEQLKERGFRPDYVSVRRAQDLNRPQINDTDLVILGAAWLGKTRLIDNVIL